MDKKPYETCLLKYSVLLKATVWDLPKKQSRANLLTPMKIKPFYELAFWLKDRGATYDPVVDFEKIKKDIVDLGGEVRRVSYPRRKRLAYQIEKQLVGFFSYIHFHIQPSALPELEESLKHHKNILRYLVVKRLEEKEMIQKIKPRIKKEEIVPPDTDEFEKKLAEILGT